jgi:hypothetical protein
MIYSSQLIPCERLPKMKQVKAFIERCIRAIGMAGELWARPAPLTEAGRWVRDNGLASLGKL